ncbi:glycosyltransferase [Shewanella sp. DC2-4]|uniref:glycosyltransferase n=1 Tax=Shewanella sp. DC2-4 TaxID=2739431 RepID=UPI0015654998|nr:glycosyltransferase [Shewanella sp. DC2-4]NRD31330.1 glycosyltransferase [Shewanella sp. DC2-4]
MPKISIIMPNYNGDKFLERAIVSFINSSWLNKELVIVDGKSTDSSHTLISKYVEKNKNIIWLNNPDDGISDAINIGLSYTSGDIIGYLGSDDLLLPDALHLVAQYWKLIPFDGLYFDSYTYDYKSNTTKYRNCPNVSFSVNNLLRYGTIVGLQNIFFASDIFKNYKYDVDNKYSMDYEFYLRILHKYRNFVHVKHPSSINIAHDNITNSLELKQTKEAFRVTKNYCTKLLSINSYYIYKRKFLNMLRRYNG